MSKLPTQWAVIVNPHSGKKISSRHWDVIYSLLKEQGLDFEYAFTEAPNHATTLAAEFIAKGYKNLLIVGGDGTLNETLNGIFTFKDIVTEDITLAIIPCGTGNDWGRFWSINRNHKKAIAHLHNGSIKKIDVGLCTYNQSNTEQKRYFINAAGIGFDPKVLAVTNFLKKFFGGYKWVYTVSVFISAIIYRAKHIELSFNGENIAKKIYTISIGNGCYTGGGIKQTPLAVPFDGLFDITLVEKPSFLKLISGLHLLFTGRLLEHPLVQAIKTSQINIAKNDNTKIEVDGIILKADTPIKFEILAEKINMLVPNNWQEKRK